MTRPIYSVRNDIGQEMTWTTGRRVAIETAAKMTEAWEKNGRLVGQHGPYQVYKSSVIRDGR